MTGHRIYVDGVPTFEIAADHVYFTLQSGDEKMQFATSRHIFARMMNEGRVTLQEVFADAGAQVVPGPKPSRKRNA